VSKTPPYWYDPDARFSALYRLPINQLWRDDDNILRDNYEGGATDMSILADIIMYDYLMPGRQPTNISGYVVVLGWSHRKVKRHMKELLKLNVVFEVNNRYFPTPYFVRGSSTSQVMVEKFIEVAKYILQLAEEHAEGSESFKEKQAELDKEIGRLDALFESHQLKSELK